MAYGDWFGYEDDYRSRRGSPDLRPWGGGRRLGSAYDREYWPRPGGLRPGAPWRRGLAVSWPGYPGEGEGARRFAAREGYGREFQAPRGRGRWSARQRDVPPDYRRYLSREEYGLGPGWDQPRREQGRDRSEPVWRLRGPLPFNEGVLGPRNALFGGEGFRRYGDDYEQWW